MRLVDVASKAAERRVCKNEANRSIRGPLAQISAATGFSFSAPSIDFSPRLPAGGVLLPK